MENRNGWTRVHDRRERWIPFRRQPTGLDAPYCRNGSRGFARTWGPGFREFSSHPAMTSYAGGVKRPHRPQDRRVRLPQHRNANHFNDQHQYRPQMPHNDAGQQHRKLKYRSDNLKQRKYRGQNDNQAQSRNRGQNNYIPANPQLKQQIKKLYKFIRLTHHLDKLIPREDGELPPTFSRLETYLCNIIQPAFPTTEITERLMENTKNWIQTTQQILREHYEATIAQLVDEFIPTMQGDWHLPFEIAGRWAYRQLGNRLQKDTITSIENILTMLLKQTPEKEGTLGGNEPPQGVNVQQEPTGFEAMATEALIRSPLISPPPPRQSEPKRQRPTNLASTEVVMEIIPTSKEVQSTIKTQQHMNQTPPNRSERLSGASNPNPGQLNLGQPGKVLKQLTITESKRGKKSKKRK